MHELKYWQKITAGCVLSYFIIIVPIFFPYEPPNYSKNKTSEYTLFCKCPSKASDTWSADSVYPVKSDKECIEGGGKPYVTWWDAHKGDYIIENETGQIILEDIYGR